MKKIVAKTLGIIILAITLNLHPVSAAFNDIDPGHTNYQAIIYLQTNNIINGYPDGTFKPNASINRAEFLKIILEGSYIPLDIFTSTSFQDIDNTAWYSPYIRKAYHEGWINGYPDGTFKPEQTINKVEALKILGQVQNWEFPFFLAPQPYSDTPVTEWYIPYVAYAKDHGFLEEEGTFFSPEDLMTRAKISEIIYRTLISNPDFTAPEDVPQNIQNFTPVSFTLVNTDFFEGITLDEQFPNHLYQNEIYFIEGTVQSNIAGTATVILENRSNKVKKTFAGKIENSHFSIPVNFSTPGNYLLGLIPEESGSSSATTISVLENLPPISSVEEIPSNSNDLAIYFDNDDQTYVEFGANNNTLKKIHFTQNNREVTYLIRQNKTKIPIFYGSFHNFSESNVNYSISTANTSSLKPLTISSSFNQEETRNFRATQHYFSDIEEDEISANPPSSFDSVHKISFSGTAETDLKQTAYVIKADGFVENVILDTNSPAYNDFGGKIISSGGSFSYSYTPSTSGTYIVEINNKNGEPSLNHSVYINNGIPITPDFFDTFERKAFEGTLDLNSARQEFLSLINQDRQEHGLKSIILSNELNDLAQNHSQDMATNNFFGHINPDGQTPDDRRVAAEIKTAVSENLAKDTSVISAHYGLMRSASHRQNILDEDWTRVGIGIVAKEGQLYITEEFSTSELTDGDLNNMQNELFTGINNERENNNLELLTKSSIVEAATTYINNQVIQNNRQLDNSLFQEALEKQNITGASELIGRVSDSGNWSTILNSIINNESTIIDAGWKLTGIDIQVDSLGDLHTILILNKPR